MNPRLYIRARRSRLSGVSAGMVVCVTQGRYPCGEPGKRHPNGTGSPLTLG